MFRSKQGRAGLLFRADGVLLTDDRKEAKKAPEQAAPFYSSSSINRKL